MWDPASATETCAFFAATKEEKMELFKKQVSVMSNLFTEINDTGLFVPQWNISIFVPVTSRHQVIYIFLGS